MAYRPPFQVRRAKGKTRGIEKDNPRRIEFEGKRNAQMGKWERIHAIPHGDVGGLLKSGATKRETSHITDHVGNRPSFNWDARMASVSAETKDMGELEKMKKIAAGLRQLLGDSAPGGKTNDKRTKSNNSRGEVCEFPTSYTP